MNKGKYRIDFRTETQYESTIKEARKTARRMQQGNDEGVYISKWEEDMKTYEPYESK